ncbi:MAG: CDP-glycerol glycerophosphotransferase family protein [Clostridium sp.]|nr:CDP-glycerol glycerophosphotransferase family protein [Clostridium sp.]
MQDRLTEAIVLNTEEGVNGLADLQEAAVIIGNNIEREKNSGDIITILEEYCEEIYVCSIKQGSSERRICLYSMKNIIETIENKIITEIQTDKIKIVFMPYKADMWTSLESIWHAAECDENYEVKVVPIPYYDISDMKNIHMKYDGDRFPSNVKITSYKEYVMEEEHPEMIFIHNPYDECNNLTRVPACYYSSNLKKNTELLVYSPYFTVGSFNRESQEFMFTAPGVYYSDYVIAQSQRVKEIFESYGHDEEKIIAFGSPKIDAIIKNNKNIQELPEIWTKKLSGKKIFLLNTHLSYFPKAFQYASSTDNYAVKFHKEILNAFLNREDCGLIWRPHPLMKNMLQGRFPECLDFINYFEKEIMQSTNGIIDETGDYAKAFYCSDALISTWSSLINEYMVTGKPILIMQRMINEEVNKVSPINRNANYFRIGKNKMTFANFRDNVLQGIDFMYEERMETVRKAFPNMDGHAGDKILEFLINKLRGGK